MNQYYRWLLLVLLGLGVHISWGLTMQEAVGWSLQTWEAIDYYTCFRLVNHNTSEVSNFVFIMPYLTGFFLIFWGLGGAFMLLKHKEAGK